MRAVGKFANALEECLNAGLWKQGTEGEEILEAVGMKFDDGKEVQGEQL